MTHQHATLEDTVYFWFASNDTSGSGNDGASAAADVRLAGGAAGDAPILSPSPTLLSHANYPAGCYEVAVAATAVNGFAATNTYAVFCTLAVDGQNPSGFIGSFTLDPIIANVKEISDDATAADNLELDYDGTGYAKANSTVGTVTTLTGHTAQTGDNYARIGVAGAGLTAINLPDQTMNITGDITGNLSGSVGSVTGAVGSVTGNVGGNVSGSVGSVTGAINTAAGTIQTLDALDTAQDSQHSTTQTNQTTILSKLLKYFQLALRSDAAIATDNATELTAINANGGSGAGDYDNTSEAQEAIRDRGDSAWITATTVDLNADQSGVTIGTVTTNTDMRGTDNAALAANYTAARAGYLDNINGHTAQTGDNFARLGAPAGASIAADIAANQTDLNTTLSRLPAALVAGKMDSDATAISGSTTAADNLEASALVIITGSAQTGTLSTTQMTTDLAEATNDHYIGRVIIWTSGVLLGQATDITDYTGASGLLTFTAVTEAPSNGDGFIII